MDAAENTFPQLPISWPLPQRSPPLTNDTRLSARTKRTPPATCSTSSSASDPERATSRPKRRRRSRARPSPPVTRVLALDQAHFKNVVHQFTDKGAPHGQCIAANLSPVPIAGSQPRGCPPAPFYPGRAAPTIARCLDSTLQKLLACVVEFLRNHSDGCASVTSPTTTTNTMALLEEFCLSQEHENVGSRQERFLIASSYLSNEPLCVPVFSQYDDAASRALLQPDQECFLKASRDEITASPSSVQGTDSDVPQPEFEDYRCSTRTIQQNLELEQDWINSHGSNDDQSLLDGHFTELERFLLDDLSGNEEIEALAMLDLV